VEAHSGNGAHGKNHEKRVSTVFQLLGNNPHPAQPNGRDAVEEVEEAADPLCGGILFEMDAACGIFWGAALAAGVRAQKGKAPGCSGVLAAAKALIEAYGSTGGSMQCGELTGMQRWSFPRYMLQGNIGRCGNQIAYWAPRFHEVIDSALSSAGGHETPGDGANCACADMKAVGRAIGFDVAPYAAVPAGLAGGLGLSGNACGALAAAIFTVCLKYFVSRDKPRHSMLRSLMQGFGRGVSWMDSSRNINEGFKLRFGSKSCADIAHRKFGSAEELAEFVNNGGCREVIDAVEELAAMHAAAS
jgi:hypothetical protein